MKLLSQKAMLEATRLTRQGRLSEAMAMLRTEQSNAAPASGHHDIREQFASVLPVIEHDPQIVGSRQSRPIPLIVEGGNCDAVSEAQSTSLPSDTSSMMNRFGHARVVMPDLAAFSGAKTRHGSPGVPVGAGFEAKTYVGEAGSRNYKLYIPGGYDGRAMPLVIMLHGCTQSPDDFAAGTQMNELAEAQGVLVAYPAQAKSANAARCWNWFEPGDQGRGRGEPAIIAGLTQAIIQDFAVAKDRVFVAGLSAGGATAAIMAARYPDIFSAVGIHSGLACGAANDVSSAFSAMRNGGAASAQAIRSTIPTIVFHGDRDQTVNSVNADQVVAQVQMVGMLNTTTIDGISEGGMSFTRTAQIDDEGHALMEKWVLHGAGHAWSGGSTAGSYTDPRGPNASAEMLRFFLQAKPCTDPL